MNTGRWTLIVVLVLVVATLAPASALASTGSGPERVYFPDTGHHLSYDFLEYWRQNGGLKVFGRPVTEEMPDPATGHTIQYFEQAVFEWDPKAPEGRRVHLRRIGVEVTEGRQDEAPFRRVVAADDEDCIFFQETGHRLSFGFREYWESNGGLANFGLPISEEFEEGGSTVQYFERARFEWAREKPDGPYGVIIGRLGLVAAVRHGVDRSPVPQSGDVQVYSPDLWYTPFSPDRSYGAVAPPAGAPTGEAKWVEINLSGQYLRAWQRDRVVFSEYVSTGIGRYPTPAGHFAVFKKLRFRDMTNGANAPPGDYYYLPDVPHVLYFLQGGYAIHGTYWHSNFGTPMSHGCVNMTLKGAEWLYNWAPPGTRVWIHY